MHAKRTVDERQGPISAVRVYETVCICDSEKVVSIPEEKFGEE